MKMSELLSPTPGQPESPGDTPSFSEGKRPPRAKPETTIWHYINVYDFLNLVGENCLWFHQFKGLQENDRREGMVVPGFWESVQKRSQEDEAAFKALQKNGEENLCRLRHFYYANCWSMSDGENALMWKAYAPGGIAIKTTVGKLVSAKITAPNASLDQSTVEYADHWSELEAKGYVHHDIPLNWLFLHSKRKAFQGESEVRFHINPPVCFFNAEGRLASPDPEKCSSWCPVTFKALDWIDQIVTAPSTPGYAVKPIRRLAEERSLNFVQSGI